MSNTEAFFGLKVPEGQDRRELYKSQYRAIYTYKMSAQELDSAFRDVLGSDWTIKNDADAIFFPQRFLDLVTGQTELMDMVPEGPVYLNNCQWGMHGPVEAVSNEAMGMYFQSGTTVCADILQRANTAELPAGADEAEYSFGEDQFMRECLEELGVTKVDAMPHILSERYACGERPQDCGDARVTFHAFKNVPEFMVCLNYAEVTGESSWPVYHKASDAAVAASQTGWMTPEEAAEDDEALEASRSVRSDEQAPTVPGDHACRLCMAAW